ncbi:MAG: hypothetical protein ACRC0L_01590 [Angustibacter sp.]
MRRCAVAAVIGCIVSLPVVATAKPAGTAERWQQTPLPRVPGQVNYAALMVSQGAAFAVGSALTDSGGQQRSRVQIAHWVDEQWRVAPTPAPPPGGSASLTAVAASSAVDVWALGSSFVPESGVATYALHYDGNSWRAGPAPQTGPGTRITGVAAPSPGTTWAVGTRYAGSASGLAFRRDDRGWTEDSPGTPDGCLPGEGGSTEFIGIAAIDDDEVYIAGNCHVTPRQRRGFILRKTASGWQKVATGPFGGHLSAITGSPRRDIWVAGTQVITGGGRLGGRGFTINGRAENWSLSFRQLVPQRFERFEGIAAGAGGIIAVGSVSRPDNTTEPLILRRVGGHWQRGHLPLAGAAGQLGVVASDSEQTWALGQRATRTGPTGMLIRPRPLPARFDASG